MKLARLASSIHKWLALLVGIQIVFWVASGFFFTLFPIERIRSEHLIRKIEAKPIDLAALPDLSKLGQALDRQPTKITLDQRASGAVILAEFAEGRPVLLDGRTLSALSPLDAERAVSVARAHVQVEGAPSSVRLMTGETTEYRGALPAWRVQFAQPDKIAVYVAADTGQVTARRSDLWRLYDTLWALHIMDWASHEDFNHPLIVATSLLTILTVVAGVVLIPYRVRFSGLRRKKALSIPEGLGSEPPAAT